VIEKRSGSTRSTLSKPSIENMDRVLRFLSLVPLIGLEDGIVHLRFPGPDNLVRYCYNST